MSIDRRKFLGAAGAALAGSFLIPKYAHAQKKHRLTILQWNHFVPQFDHWLDEVFARQWGDANDTEVVIDRVGMTSLYSRAQAEIQRGRGHDLFMFLRPPPTYEDHVIDHAEIYQELAGHVGRPNEIGLKSTYNPKTRKYFGFSESYVPDPINYRKDLWDDVGVYPDSWDDIRRGGSEIMRRHKVPVGIGLAPELDSNMMLRSLMHSFGASLQDESGRIVLDSPATIEALEFMKSFYEGAITEEVFSWDPSSNNRMMLAGHGSLTLNAISITRTAETQKIPISENIHLAPAARGPVRRLGLMHLMHVYVIWNFARNIDGAKQFLVDYTRNFREAFLASRFYNIPCFPETVPDLKSLVAQDAAATPTDKYSVLSQVEDWTTTIGYPGYANAVADETFSQWIVSDMFSAVARGRTSAQEAVRIARARIDEIHARWKAAGKV